MKAECCREMFVHIGQTVTSYMTIIFMSTTMEGYNLMFNLSMTHEFEFQLQPRT